MMCRTNGNAACYFLDMLQAPPNSSRPAAQEEVHDKLMQGQTQCKSAHKHHAKAYPFMRDMMGHPQTCFGLHQSERG